MPNPVCSSLRDSLLAYLAEQTAAHEVDGDCVLTVPMNTADNRWVDIVIESRGTDFFVVHDDGKAADELFLQGVPQSDKRGDTLKAIGRRYGVDVDEGRFLVGCTSVHLQHSIWAVAHCSGLAMGELLRHKPNIEDEAVRDAVGGIITNYGLERHIRVQRSVSVKGETAQHSFDFLADNGNRTVAINVLNPGQSSIGRAQRYGFQGLDLRETYFAYKKLAVLAHPEVWSGEAKRIVSTMANKTIEFTTQSASSLVIVESLDELLGRAA